MSVQVIAGADPKPLVKLLETTWLDRAVLWLDPQRGMNRIRCRTSARLAEHFTRSAVGGAAGNRLRIDWTSNTTTLDAALRQDRARIRNIVRDLCLGNPYAAGARNRVRANVVSTGITPQCAVQMDTPESEPDIPPPGWRPISEREAHRFEMQAEKLWDEIAESADVEGDSSIYEMQGIVQDGLEESGEILVHWPRLKRKGHPVGFGVELIEVDRLSTPTTKWNDPNIRDGVEVDPATGETVAYWVVDVHPGDDLAQRTGKYTRIPRWYDDGTPRMKLLYYKRRPGQKRGYSSYAPCLEIFEDLHRYWEAELVAARVAACYAAFVTSPVAGPMQVAAGTVDTQGKRREKLEPGLIWYGAPGEDVSFGDPKRPNSAFGSFTEILLRSIGVCQDLPYELIALNFSMTNYSSARAALLEARRTFQTKQRFQVNGFGRDTWRMAMREGIASGRLDAPGFAGRQLDWLAATWTPPGWGWVDPVDEETAARESIRGFLSSHADECAAQGKDFDTLAEKCSREHKKLKELGLPSPWDAIAPGAALRDPKSVAKPGEKPAKEPAKEPVKEEANAEA